MSCKDIMMIKTKKIVRFSPKIGMTYEIPTFLCNKET